MVNRYMSIGHKHFMC